MCGSRAEGEKSPNYGCNIAQARKQTNVLHTLLFILRKADSIEKRSKDEGHTVDEYDEYLIHF